MADLDKIRSDNINDTSNSILEMVEAFYRIMVNDDIDKSVRNTIYQKKIKPFLSGDIPILTGVFRHYQDYNCPVYAFDGIKLDGQLETDVVKLKKGIDDDRCRCVYRKVTPFSQPYVGYMYGIGQAQRIIESNHNYPDEVSELAIFRYPHTLSLITNTRFLIQILTDIYAIVNPLRMAAESFTGTNTITDMDLFSYLLPMYGYISYWGNKIHSVYSPVTCAFNGIPVKIDFRANYSVGVKEVMLRSDKSHNDSNVTVYELNVIMNRVTQSIVSENGEDFYNDEADDISLDEI